MRDEDESGPKRSHLRRLVLFLIYIAIALSLVSVLLPDHGPREFLSDFKSIEWPSLIGWTLLIVGFALAGFGVRKATKMNESRPGTTGYDFNATEWGILTLTGFGWLAYMAIISPLVF